MLKDAQKYVDVKEYGKAKELLELEIKSDPKNVDAYLLLGKVRLMDREPDGASESFDKALILSTKAKGKIAGAYLEAAKTLYSDKDKKGRSGRAIRLYLEKATTYDPDFKKEVAAWALEEAEKATATEKTTDPIDLLSFAGETDADSRKGIGTFALKTAKAYQEKNFLPEAISWGLLAGDMSADVLKDAAGVLRDAAIMLPLPEERDRAKAALAKAFQWNPSLEEDDDSFWVSRVKLGDSAMEGAKAYLERFPAGKHAGEAKPLADVEPFRVAMGDMRMIATAVEAFAVDYNRYPPSLSAGVSPTYIKTIPEKDPWGAPYVYETNFERTSYRITSGGTDRSIRGSQQPPPASPDPSGTFPTSAAGEDIVYQNGQFVRYPEGI